MGLSEHRMLRVEERRQGVQIRPRKERVFEIRRPESVLGWVGVTMVVFAVTLPLVLFITNVGISGLIDLIYGVCDMIWNLLVALVARGL